VIRSLAISRWSSAMKVERAHALELRPDDFLIVSIPIQLNVQQVTDASRAISRELGHRPDRVVVVDNGATFMVLRKVEGQSEE
jgi:hypothetical protein